MEHREKVRLAVIDLWDRGYYLRTSTVPMMEDAEADLERWWQERRRGAALPLLHEALSHAQTVVSRYAARGIQLICAGDVKYPKYLRGVTGRPAVLAVRGDIDLLSAPQVAIVGSRQTHPSAERLTACIADALISRGAIMTSGGAYGIDALVHRHAMGREKPTIVVTASCDEPCVPSENADIFDYAVAHGAVITPFPLNQPARRAHFPLRNALMAGLSLACVIIHCREQSGALYTATASLRCSRPVYVAATDGFDVLTEGGLQLVKSGRARLLSSGEDIDIPQLSPKATNGIQGILPLSSEADDASGNLFPSDTCTQIAIMNHLLKQPLTRESLRRRVESPEDFDDALLELELSGRVQNVGGVYRTKGHMYVHHR